MSEQSPSQRGREGELLHQLRSSLARAQAEAEILQFDGVGVTGVLGAVSEAIARLKALEDSLLQVTADAAEVGAIVVDDDARLGELTAARLLKRGIRAEHYRDLHPVLSSAPRDRLVIDLSVLMRASDDERSTLRGRPFIVVSGENSASAYERAMTLGAAAYFVKPVDIDALASRLKALQATRA